MLNLTPHRRLLFIGARLGRGEICGNQEQTQDRRRKQMQEQLAVFWKDSTPRAQDKSNTPVMAVDLSKASVPRNS